MCQRHRSALPRWLVCDADRERSGGTYPGPCVARELWAVTARGDRAQVTQLLAHDGAVAAEGYWAKRGWSEVGEVRTQSRIDTPQTARVGEPTWIAGVAWAGDRQISRVEVSVDGGRSWQRAMLDAPRSAVAWTRWAYRWTPERAGTVRVLCRASDGTGRRQDAVERPPHPDGATGYHDTEIRVAT